MPLRFFSEYRIEYALERKGIPLFPLIDDGNAHFYDIVERAFGRPCKRKIDRYVRNFVQLIDERPALKGILFFRQEAKNTSM